MDFKDYSLPESALPAFQAYNAMEATKERHLRYLKILEGKYEKYGEPSEVENEFIAQLLRDHDQMVSSFKDTMRKLRSQHEVAHKQLLTYITLLNDQM